MTTGPRRDDRPTAAFVDRHEHRDPALFAAEMARLAAAAPPASDGHRLALGLDPATRCGFCLSWFRAGAPYDPRAAFTVMGQLDLAAGPYDSGAIRFVRLRQFLAAAAPAIVFYEEPRFTPAEAVTRRNAGAIVARAATAMELIGAFKTTICAGPRGAGPVPGAADRHPQEAGGRQGERRQGRSDRRDQHHLRRRPRPRGVRVERPRQRRGRRGLPPRRPRAVRARRRLRAVRRRGPMIRRRPRGGTQPPARPPESPAYGRPPGRAPAR